MSPRERRVHVEGPLMRLRSLGVVQGLAALVLASACSSADEPSEHLDLPRAQEADVDAADALASGGEHRDALAEEAGPE